jgi:YesN/AraC family two-component response regulator
MVCPRCILVVNDILTELGAHVLTIRLGYVSIQMPQTVNKDMIESQLNKFGFELLEDKQEILIEQLKQAIQNYIKKLENSSKEAMLSDFLAHEIGKNYNFLSKLFSKSQGITIEAYYIDKRVDRVKELIKHDELNLSEIAVKLGYSSVHYISSQFKRVTGLSVSEYKEVIRKEN